MLSGLGFYLRLISLLFRGGVMLLTRVGGEIPKKSFASFDNFFIFCIIHLDFNLIWLRLASLTYKYKELSLVYSRIF
jgi:hypothetical protein